jgi:hypothetical protein
MKKFGILILAFIFSCNQYKSNDSFCLKKIEYVNQRQKLIASIVKIQIEDSNDVLKEKMMQGKLKDVILYSIEKDDRKFFYLTPFGTGKQFKIENGVIILPIITTLFENDLGNKLSNKEIQQKLNGKVGLVFGKDTIVIKKCDNF